PLGSGRGVVYREADRQRVFEAMLQPAFVGAGGIEDVDHRLRVVGVFGVQVVGHVDLPTHSIDGDARVPQGAELPRRGDRAIDRRNGGRGGERGGVEDQDRVV